MPDPKLYKGRSQTYVKHYVLEHYLEKLAYKLGWNGGVLNYVDCFAAKQSLELELSGQTSLFTSPMGRSYSDELQERYHKQAQARILDLLEDEPRLLFDRLEEEALQYPMTSTKDLKDWLVRMQGTGMLQFDGLKPRARVPQPGQNHYVVLLRHH